MSYFLVFLIILGSPNCHEVKVDLLEHNTLSKPNEIRSELIFIWEWNAEYEKYDFIESFSANMECVQKIGQWYKVYQPNGSAIKSKLYRRTETIWNPESNSIKKRLLAL